MYIPNQSWRIRICSFIRSPGEVWEGLVYTVNHLDSLCLLMYILLGNRNSKNESGFSNTRIKELLTTSPSTCANSACKNKY